MNITSTFNLLIQLLNTFYIYYLHHSWSSKSRKLILPREQFGPLNPVPLQSHSLLTIRFTHLPPLWHFPPKLGVLHASRHPGIVRSLFNKRARRNFFLPVANLGVFIQPSNLGEKNSSWSLSNWIYLFIPAMCFSLLIWTCSLLCGIFMSAVVI